MIRDHLQQFARSIVTFWTIKVEFSSQTSQSCFYNKFNHVYTKTICHRFWRLTLFCNLLSLYFILIVLVFLTSRIFWINIFLIKIRKWLSFQSWGFRILLLGLNNKYFEHDVFVESSFYFDVFQYFFKTFHFGKKSIFSS